jgi:NAD(P)-dependent dehydrogenase (short-subunit alcohol dehydrogenase family)
VSKAEQVKALAAYAQQQLGSIDLWINNAGTNAYKYGPLLESDDDDLEAIVDTNILGVMLCCKEVRAHGSSTNTTTGLLSMAKGMVIEQAACKLAQAVSACRCSLVKLRAACRPSTARRRSQLAATCCTSPFCVGIKDTHNIILHCVLCAGHQSHEGAASRWPRLQHGWRRRRRQRHTTLCSVWRHQAQLAAGKALLQGHWSRLRVRCTCCECGYAISRFAAYGATKHSLQQVRLLSKLHSIAAGTAHLFAKGFYVTPSFAAFGAISAGW